MTKKNNKPSPKTPASDDHKENLSENGNDNNKESTPAETPDEDFDLDAFEKENARKIEEEFERRQRENNKLFDSFSDDDDLDDAPFTLEDVKEAIQKTDQVQNSINTIHLQKEDFEKKLLETKSLISNVEKELKVAQLKIASALVTELTPALDALKSIAINVPAQEREKDKKVHNLSNSVEKTIEKITATFNKYSAPLSAAEDIVLTSTNAPRAIVRGDLPAEGDEDAILDALDAEDERLLKLSQELLSLQKELPLLARQIKNNQEVLERRQRNAEEEKQFAASKFIKDIINDLDSLEMSIGFINDKMRHDSPALKTVAGAIEDTLDSICVVFNKHGVLQINPIHQAFDEHKHEALDTREVAGVAPETVVEVFQKGYEVKGRIIRPARVVVTPA